jgi:hypothetical protein
VNEARFIREFLTWAEPNHIYYNVIEAFDQPWKRLLEGTAGGYWGIYNAGLHEKFAASGPVTEEPRFRLALVAGAITGLLFALVSLFARRCRSSTVFIAFILGDGIGACVAAQVRELVRAERTPLEWAIGIALSLFSLASALVLSRILVAWDADRETLVAPHALAKLREREHSLSSWVSVIRFGWLYLASVMNLLLIFDGRYRDFPIFLYAAPVAGLGLLACLSEWHDDAHGREEVFLATWVVISSVIVLFLETLQNGPADLWVLLCLALGAPALHFVVMSRLRAQQQKRA